MVDNSLGDADFYDAKDYVGIGKRLIMMLIDAVALFFVIVVLSMAVVLLFEFGFNARPSERLLRLIFFLSAWIYLGPIKRSRFGWLLAHWCQACFGEGWLTFSLGDDIANDNVDVRTIHSDHGSIVVGCGCRESSHA